MSKPECLLVGQAVSHFLVMVGGHSWVDVTWFLPLWGLPEDLNCTLFQPFKYFLLAGQFAVAEPILKFNRESIERTVSITFCYTFFLPICFVIFFNIISQCCQMALQ